MIPTEFAPLASHIWQSTLFAAAAVLLTLALRRNRARIRHTVLLIASYKFLLPFSWLVSLGREFRWRTAPAAWPHSVSTVTDVISAPTFLIPTVTAEHVPDHLALLPLVIRLVWGSGVLIVAAGWIREWLRIRAAVRGAAPLPLALPIPVVSVPSRLEPGVFGIFRPVLLLPKGIAEKLSAAQLRVVLAHELCHVRWRDNLAAAVHMLVEGLFWFHPLVWWLDHRIVEERERACDEEVLRMGGAPVAYAETLLAVCKSYVESPIACMSGISGSDLKRRVVNVMANRLIENLNPARKLLLSALGIVAIAAPIVFGVVAAPLLHAQSSATAGWEKAAGGQMKFEVASIKEDKAPPNSDTVHFNVPITTWDSPAGAPTGGLYSATNLPFYVYLGFAYKPQGYALDAIERQLPKWAGFSGKRYDIEARAAGNPTRDQYRLMMQSLLADRFKLLVHWETKQMPVLALVVSKPGRLGPHLRAHREVPPCSDFQEAVLPQIVPAIEGGFPLDCGVIAHDRKNVAAGNARYFARNVPMSSLAVTLTYASRDTQKPVVDKTGLAGNYDFVFEYTPDSLSQPRSDGITLIGALKDDLGLKLEPTTAPVDLLILDHIEEPSTN